MLTLLLSALLTGPAAVSSIAPADVPAGVSTAVTLRAGDEFAEAHQNFVRALQGRDNAARTAALAKLVDLMDPSAAAPLVSEYGSAAGRLRELSEKEARTRYALERRQVVFENLRALAERDDDVKHLVPKEEEAIQELKDDLARVSGNRSETEAWVADLRAGTGRLFDGISASKRKRAEAELSKDALEHPDHQVRLASIELWGAVGVTGTSLQLQRVVVDANRSRDDYQERLVEELDKIRKVEKRLQEEQARTGGQLSRSSNSEYQFVKKNAAEIRRTMTQLDELAAAAARAAGASLAREEGKELDKTLSKLLLTIKKAKGRTRLDSLAILSTASSDAVRARTRELLGVEKDPLARAELIDGLTNLGDRELVPQLLERWLLDVNWYVRSRAAASLARMRVKAAIPVLIGRLEVEEGRLRTDIGNSLISLTGKNFRGNVELWKRWWADEGEAFEVPESPPERDLVAEARESEGKSVNFFGISTESQKVLFVLDLSGSMKFAMVPKTNPDDDPGRPYDMPGEGDVSRLDVAKRDLIKALGGVKDGGLFNIVLYASDVWTWDDELVEMEPEVREDVLEFIGKADAVGGTNIYGSLDRALEIAGASGEGEWKEPDIDTIYVLTDGKASVGVTQDTDEILAMVRERNRATGITIHTVGLSAAHDAELLRRLAEENGGVYVSR